MGKYDLNKHNRRIFPWFWQTIENMSFVDVLMSVFDNVNDSYETSEADYRQKVGYSIQRLSLEESLNDKFDPNQRRIVVINSLSTGGDFVFNESETITTDLEKFVFNEAESLGSAEEVYFFNNGESQGSAIAPFKVVVPIGYQALEQEIRAWIEYPQITGTEYELIFI